MLLSLTRLDLSPETLRTLPTRASSLPLVSRTARMQLCRPIDSGAFSNSLATFSMLPTGAWTLRSTPVRNLVPVPTLVPSVVRLWSMSK